ncbi:hypothetical protein Taro_021813, partial [Colocasia esculenta]|nr:hypothetical protein [Colocasia esculenta]
MPSNPRCSDDALAAEVFDPSLAVLWCLLPLRSVAYGLLLLPSSSIYGLLLLPSSSIYDLRAAAASFELSPTKLYVLYLDLKNRSGWGWDDDKHMPVPGDQETWEDLVARKTEFKKIQGKPFLFMEQLTLICSNSLARGDNAALNVGTSFLDIRNDNVDVEDEDDTGIDLGIEGGTPEYNVRQSHTPVNVDVNEGDNVSPTSNIPSTTKRKHGVMTNNSAIESL